MVHRVSRSKGVDRLCVSSIVDREVDVDKSNPAPLTELERVALATAIKETELNGCKGSLTGGTTANVDFVARIHGTVSKGTPSPGSSWESAATVCLRTFAIFLQVLRNCGIGEGRLRRALEEVTEPTKVTEDQKLAQVFKDVETEKASKLPKVTGFTPGQAGRVTSQIQVERVEA